MARTLSGSNIPGKSWPGSDDNEGGALRVPQSSSITRTSLSNCLMSHPGHLLGGGWVLTSLQRDSQRREKE